MSGFGRQCTKTDDNGNAALEIGGSAVTNSVTAWFENEGINVSIASKSGQFPAAAPSTTPLSDTAVVKALIASGTKSGAVSAAAIRHRLVVQRPKIAARSIKLARVVHLVGHHAQMQVFVKGKPGSVALRITITNGKGKSHTVTRIVRVNKLATIKHLRVSTAARISVKIA